MNDIPIVAKIFPEVMVDSSNNPFVAFTPSGLEYALRYRYKRTPKTLKELWQHHCENCGLIPILS